MHNDSSSDKETATTAHLSSESGWEKWQGLYSLKRSEVFRRIVEALKKHLPGAR